MNDGTYAYAYDGEGNRVRRTDVASGAYTVYVWDHRNRMTAAEFYTSTGALAKRIEYVYDVKNLRIAKRADDNGDGVIDREEKFVYDGDRVALAYDGNDVLTNRFLHGPVIDQVFADERAVDQILWSLGDRQNTVHDLVEYDAGTDGTTAVKHVTYDSFGRTTSETNTALDLFFAWTGRERDADLDQQYNRARWYDYLLGEFTSEDLKGFAAGDAHLRRYARNNPTNFTDPSGMDPPGEPDESQRKLTQEEQKYAYYVLATIARQASWIVGEEVEDIKAEIASTLAQTTLWNVNRMDSRWYVLWPPFIEANMALSYGNAEAVTIGYNQFYGNMPRRSSEEFMPLLIHEVSHGVDVADSNVGTQIWLAAYLAEAGMQAARRNDEYRGLKTEIVGYALESTVRRMQNRYPDLYESVINGTVEQRYPDVDEEMIRTYEEYVRQYWQKYRPN